MMKKYIADLDEAIDDDSNEDKLDFFRANSGRSLHKLFNEGRGRYKVKKSHRKSGAKRRSAHQNWPHDWKDFDYGNDYYCSIGEY